MRNAAQRGLTLQKVGGRRPRWGRGPQSPRNGPHRTLREGWPEAGTKPRSRLAGADPPPVQLRAGLSGALHCSVAWSLSRLT